MPRHEADDPQNQSVGNKKDSERGRGKTDGEPRKVDPPRSEKREPDDRHRG
jgi:hypothetical protein